MWWKLTFDKFLVQSSMINKIKSLTKIYKQHTNKILIIITRFKQNVADSDESNGCWSTHSRSILILVEVTLNMLIKKIRYKKTLLSWRSCRWPLWVWYCFRRSEQGNSVLNVKKLRIYWMGGGEFIPQNVCSYWPNGSTYFQRFKLWSIRRRHPFRRLSVRSA